MPYLALDTATTSLSVAVGERGKLFGEATTQLSRNHSVKLMPLVENLLIDLDISPSELKGFVIGRGPGSYTGVRIAVTAVKAMAFGLEVPLVGVSSLDGLARHGALSDALVVPMFDARRRQAYTSLYENQNGNFVKLQEDRLLVLDDILRAIQSRMVVRRLDKTKPAKVLLLGDGAENHRAELQEKLGEKAWFATSPTQNFVRAAHLLDVGIPLLEAGQVEDPATFAPDYLQLVEAEAKWLAAQQATSGGEHG